MGDSIAKIVEHIIGGTVIVLCLFFIVKCHAVPINNNHEIRKLEIQKEMLMIEKGMPLDKTPANVESPIHP